jgi:hypothetical protein
VPVGYPRAVCLGKDRQLTGAVDLSAVSDDHDAESLNGKVDLSATVLSNALVSSPSTSVALVKEAICARFYKNICVSNGNMRAGYKVARLTDRTVSIHPA